jgi:putative tricarboxylic transport membrane protein
VDFFLSTFAGAGGLLADPITWICLIGGVLWGSASGATPGMNTTLAVALGLPISFVVGPVQAVIFLVAITVGVNFGNSVPAIVVGVPGTPSAVFTALDGYALHKAGKSGLALGVTFVASVLGQGFSSIFFLAMVIPLSGLVYIFLAPEMFALYLLGMTALIGLTGKNVVKGLIAMGRGVIMAMIGSDPLTLTTRLTFGVPELRYGLPEVPVILGLLAVSHIFVELRQSFRWNLGDDFSDKFPKWREIRGSLPWVGLGTVLGTLVGAIPGVGGVPAAAFSYQQAKGWWRRHGSQGAGSIEAVGANESAQSSSQAGEMVPTFGLGIPASGSMVVVLSALTLHGLIPGPRLIRDKPELLDAAFLGLLGGTVILAVVGWWIGKAVLKVVLLDRSAVFIGALVLSIVGVYSLRRAFFDVIVMLVVGVVGYFMSRYGFPTAAAALAVILAPGAESMLRQGLLLEDGDPVAFLLRPITFVILLLSVGVLVFGFWNTFGKRSLPSLPDETHPEATEDLPVVGRRLGKRKPPKA